MPSERGNDPAGATIYVTLEPCAHTGSQPPCADGLIEAGVAEVVIAAEDPTEKTRGHRTARLEEAGIKVRWAERTAGRRRARPDSGFPQAGRDRQAAGHPEDGDEPRRQSRDPDRRLEVDLRRGKPGDWSTSGGPGWTRSRSGREPCWPTTRG